MGIGDGTKRSIYLVLLAPLTLWWGFVLMALWNWFLPSIGAPPIGLVQAIGISIVAAYFTIGIKKNEEENELFESLGSLVAFLIVKAGVTGGFFLLFGWIVSLFM